MWAWQIIGESDIYIFLCTVVRWKDGMCWPSKFDEWASNMWLTDEELKLRKKVLDWRNRKTIFILLVFCYQNCSELLGEKIVLVSENFLKIKHRGWRQRICKKFEITRTICWNCNSERSKKILVNNRKAEVLYNVKNWSPFITSKS